MTSIFKKFLICTFLLSIFGSPVHAKVVPPEAISKCQKCHGKDFSGKRKNPPINNLSYDEILQSMTTDIPKKMKRTVNKLTEQQKKDIADFIFNSRIPTEN